MDAERFPIDIVDLAIRSSNCQWWRRLRSLADVFVREQTVDLCAELRFCSREVCQQMATPVLRHARIPAQFDGAAAYQRVLKATLHGGQIRNVGIICQRTIICQRGLEKSRKNICLILTLPNCLWCYSNVILENYNAILAFFHCYFKWMLPVP